MADGTEKLDALINAGEEITLGGKKFIIKAPSIAVTRLINKKLFKIFNQLGLNAEVFEQKELKEIVNDMFMRVYKVLIGEDNSEIFEDVLDVVIMLLTNQPYDKAEIDREWLLWNVTVDELMVLLLKVFEAGKLPDFFLMLLKLLQAYNLGTLQKNSQTQS